MKAASGRPGRGLALLVLAGILAAPSCAKKPKEGTAQLPPEQVFKTAIQKLQRKHYYTARNMLQQIVPRIPPEDRDLLPRVQLAIAESYYRDGGLLNYGESLNGYRNFLTYYPNHEKSDEAQFMVGMSLFKQVLSPDRDQVLTLKAIDEFRKVETVYPDSRFAVQARKQIDACLDLLADHERQIGGFYQRRRAWQAAIDRYQGVLDKYPHYRGLNGVLFDLGACHLKVGNRLAAEAAFGQLWHDDPNGKMSRKARGLLGEVDRLEDQRRRKEAGR